MQAGLNKRIKNLVHYSSFAFVLIAILWSFYAIIDDTDFERVGNWNQVVNVISRFFPPDILFLPKLILPTIDTFLMAIMGTVLAIIFAIPVAILAAHNVTPYYPITYPIGRFIMTVSRSVHEIVWALIFVIALGLGPFPGILAIAVRSIGFLSKLTAEAIEDVDIAPIEAIKSTGANKARVVLFGIVPQILPVFIGNGIFAWDINVRRASIMGFVGAGGIGLEFRTAMVQYQYHKATTVIIAILILVLIGEWISTILRKSII